MTIFASSLSSSSSSSSPSPSSYTKCLFLHKCFSQGSRSASLRARRFRLHPKTTFSVKQYLLKTAAIVLIKDRANAWINSAPRMHHKQCNKWDHRLKSANRWVFPMPQENGAKLNHKMWNHTDNKRCYYGH